MPNVPLNDQIPEYAAWMFEPGFGIDELPPEPPKLSANPPQSLWDLPIYGRFWAADGADLSR